MTPRPDLRDGEPVALTAVAQFDCDASGRRRPAVGRAARTRRSAPDRPPSRPRRARSPACSSATSAWRTGTISPPSCRRSSQVGVDLAGAQLRAVEQVEQEALVGRAAVDDDHRVGERAAQPRQRLVAVAAPGDDLGDHRVELGAGWRRLRRRRCRRARPGPSGSRSSAIRPGAGAKPSAGSSAFRRASMAWPDGRRRLALQAPARGHVELELDEVEPGDRLGHGVLDLEARVDLHEREAALRRLVEELDGPRVAVARRAAPAGAPRCITSRSCSAVSAGLADSSITFWLRRWQQQSRTPTAHAVPWPSAITCTSTWRAAATSRSSSTVPSPNACTRLGAGALEGGGQRVRVVDAADAAAAAARRRLDHQREADPLCVARASSSCRRDRRSTARPGRRPPRPAAWRRSCRRRGASRRRPGRRTRCRAARRARRTPGARRRSPSRPRPRRRGGLERALERRVVEVAARRRRPRRVATQTASSASRTNIASRSGSV